MIQIIHSGNPSHAYHQASHVRNNTATCQVTRPTHYWAIHTEILTCLEKLSSHIFFVNDMLSSFALTTRTNFAYAKHPCFMWTCQMKCSLTKLKPWELGDKANMKLMRCLLLPISSKDCKLFAKWQIIGPFKLEHVFANWSTTDLYGVEHVYFKWPATVPSQAKLFFAKWLPTSVFGDELFFQLTHCPSRVEVVCSFVTRIWFVQSKNCQCLCLLYIWNFPSLHLAISLLIRNNIAPCATFRWDTLQRVKIFILGRARLD